MSRVGAPATPNPGNRALDRLRAVPMEDAVGYPTIECAHEILDEHALILKHDRLFLLVNAHGDITPAGVCSLGLFHDDTRILSHYRLAVCGGPPVFLSAEAPSAYGAQIDLAVKDLPFGGNPWDPKNVIHVRRPADHVSRAASCLPQEVKMVFEGGRAIGLTCSQDKNENSADRR